MFTLRDAHAPYLPMLNACECALCLEVSYARPAFDRYGRPAHGEQARRYWAAISDRLQALTEGRHVFVPLADRAASARAAFIAEHGREPRPQEGVVKVRMSDFYGTGMGLGVGGRIT